MHPAPAWLAPMTDDLAHVRAVLQEARPGFEKTRYAPALQLAGDALAAVPAGTKTLAWMADEQRLGWLGVDLNRALPAGVKVRLAPPAPAPGRQAAIVALRRLGAGGGRPAAGRRRHGAIVRSRSRTSGGSRCGSPTDRRSPNKPFPCTRATTRWNCVSPCRPTPPACAFPCSNRTTCPPTTPPGWRRRNPRPARCCSTPRRARISSRTRCAPRNGWRRAAWSRSRCRTRPWPLDAVAVVRGSAAFRPPQAERLEHFVDGGGPLWLFVDGSPEQTAWLQKQGVGVTPRAPAPDGGAEHLRDWDPEHPILAAFAGQSLLPLLNVEFYRGFDLAGDALLPIANWPDGKIGPGRMERRRPAHPAGRVPAGPRGDQLARPTLVCPVRASGGALAGIGGRGAQRLAGGRRDPAAAGRGRLARAGRRVAAAGPRRQRQRAPRRAGLVRVRRQRRANARFSPSTRRPRNPTSRPGPISSNSPPWNPPRRRRPPVVPGDGRAAPERRGGGKPATLLVVGAGGLRRVHPRRTRPGQPHRHVTAPTRSAHEPARRPVPLTDRLLRQHDRWTRLAWPLAILAAGLAATLGIDWRRHPSLARVEQWGEPAALVGGRAWR